MGTLTYNFEGDTVGTMADGWSHLYGDSGMFKVKLGKKFGPDSTVTLREKVICDDTGSLTDAVMTGKFSRSSAAQELGVWMRHTGDSENDGYLFYIGTNYLACYTYVNGSNTGTVWQQTGLTIDAAVEYNFRIESTSSTLRMWYGTGSWPSTWTGTGTDTTHSAGYILLSNHGDANAGRFDDLAITSDDIGGISPTLGTLEITGLDPDVTVGVAATSGLGTLEITGYNPAVKQVFAVAPTLGTIEVTGYDPVVSAPSGVVPTLGTLEITGYSPTVTATSSTLVDLFFKFKDASGTVYQRQFWVRPLVTETSSDYTVKNYEEHVMVDATAAARAITMPSAVGREGYVYTVSKTDSSANAVTIAGIGGQTINGDANLILYYQDESVTLISDGANWRVI